MYSVHKAPDIGQGLIRIEYLTEPTRRFEAAAVSANAVLPDVRALFHFRFVNRTGEMPPCLTDCRTF